MNSKKVCPLSPRPVTSAALFAFAAFAVSCVPTLFSSALPPVFQGLGTLPRDNSSTAAALSADGQVVVGETFFQTQNTGYTTTSPFRWSIAGGMEALATPFGGVGGSAWATSATGVITLGGAAAPGDVGVLVPTIWTSPIAFFQPDIAASFPSDFAAVAADMSGDGGVVVGFATNGTEDRAFRWTLADGVWNLGAQWGMPSKHGRAVAISADGKVIVGSGLGVAAGAFHWTQAGGAIALGTLPGDNRSDPHALSADGRVAVGASQHPQPTPSDSSFHLRRACRWSTWQIGNLPLTQVVDLSDSADPESDAWAVSADGNVIGGYATAFGAMIWDADNGMRDVKSMLENQYNLAAELQGWWLKWVTGVATDDTYLYLTGTGVSPSFNLEAWWARVPKPPRITNGLKLRVPLLFNREPYYVVCDPAGPYGPVRFAVLGTTDFDTRSLMRSSIRFGNATSAMATTYEYRDVNRDGLMDLTLQFNLPDVYRGMDWRNTKVLRLLGTTTRGVDVVGEILVQPQIR